MLLEAERAVMESNLVHGTYTVTPGLQTTSLVRRNHNVPRVCPVMTSSARSGCW